LPAFGVKEDAIQGRTNETWFNVDTPGIYYGQCSELCGVNHAYMPIEIHAVSREEFDAWIATQGGSFASAEPAPATTAPEGATPPATEQPAATPASAPTR
jgi:cytochrome c oxidase subunit II